MKAAGAVIDGHARYLEDNLRSPSSHESRLRSPRHSANPYKTRGNLCENPGPRLHGHFPKALATDEPLRPRKEKLDEHQPKHLLLPSLHLVVTIQRSVASGVVVVLVNV